MLTLHGACRKVYVAEYFGHPRPGYLRAHAAAYLPGATLLPLLDRRCNGRGKASKGRKVQAKEGKCRQREERSRRGAGGAWPSCIYKIKSNAAAGKNEPCYRGANLAMPTISEFQEGVALGGPGQPDSLQLSLLWCKEFTRSYMHVLPGTQSWLASPKTATPISPADPAPHEEKQEAWFNGLTWCAFGFTALTANTHGQVALTCFHGHNQPISSTLQQKSAKQQGSSPVHPDSIEILEMMLLKIMERRPPKLPSPTHPSTHTPTPSVILPQQSSKLRVPKILWSEIVLDSQRL
eukprot:594914-Pelagomonas_calceolata.AAC.2